MTAPHRIQRSDNPASEPALVGIVASFMKGRRDCATPVENVDFFFRDRPLPPTTCMIEPSIVVVFQGVKEMIVDGEAFAYDIHRFLITSLDLPANSAVIEASREAPCLGLSMKLDLRILAELISQSGVVPPRRRTVRKGIGVGTMTPSLMAPLRRLVELIEEPDAIPVLAPLIQREIHFRLLKSDQADLLRQIVSHDGHGHRVAKAIDWLKLHYGEPFRVEDLAARVGMSLASFNHHFRQLTAMSPLQYQKRLRLGEARRLMLNEQSDAAGAAFKVGYESPSQFSREYARVFGMPPKRDIEALRKQAAGIAAP